jgi:hypothetical protein
MEMVRSSSTLTEVWVLILCGLIVSFAAGCRPTGNSIAVSTPSPTPSVLESMQTRTVVADGFTILVPVDFKDAPWHGTDSSGWSIQSKGMKISTETGPYAPDAKNYGYENFRDGRKTIDGQDVPIATYVIPKQTGLIDPNKRNCVSAYFDASDRHSSELGVHACFEDPQDEALARAIIESIRFVAVETKSRN